MNLNTDDLKSYKDEELQAAKKAVMKELNNRKKETEERKQLEKTEAKYGYKLVREGEAEEKPAEVKTATPFKV
jgi:hypothetical protein